MDESQLIQAMKTGSLTAFNRLFEMYAARLFAFCFQYCKSAQEAEEIVDDAFVRIWRERASIQQEQTLKPLLFLVAHRLLINAYRSSVNAPSFAAYLEYVDASVEASDRADYQLEYDDFMQRLDQAIATLPSTQQKVVRLSKLEGMTNEEIQQLLGISLQTVKNSLVLAMKALRKKLGLWVVLLAI